MGNAVGNRLSCANAPSPLFLEHPGIFLVFELSPLAGSLDVLDHAVMNHKMSQTRFSHSEAQVDVLASVEVSLVKSAQFQKDLPLGQTTGRSDGAPLPDLSLEGTMPKALPVMPRVSLGGKDHPHMIESPRSRQSLNVPDHSHLFLRLEDREHRNQPITVNENVIVQKAEVVSLGFPGDPVVVSGKALVLPVVKDSVGLPQSIQEVGGPVLACVIYDQDLVLDSSPQGPLQTLQAFSGAGKLAVDRDENADLGSAHPPANSNALLRQEESL